MMTNSFFQTDVLAVLASLNSCKGSNLSIVKMIVYFLDAVDVDRGGGMRIMEVYGKQAKCFTGGASKQSVVQNDSDIGRVGQCHLL